MASIDNATTQKKRTGRRLIKKSTGVDLTPMVDLGFLLISFFVFTTTMATPTVMKVEVPIDTDIFTDICSSCVLTTILGDNNQILYYEGNLDTATLKTTDYKTIRQVIQHKQKMVKAATGDVNRFVLIIKPTDQSDFKNFVNMTDEVTINQIKRYYIDRVTGKEQQKIAF